LFNLVEGLCREVEGLCRIVEGLCGEIEGLCGRAFYRETGAQRAGFFPKQPNLEFSGVYIDFTALGINLRPEWVLLKPSYRKQKSTVQIRTVDQVFYCQVPDQRES
jgi:hypothetical protein